MPHNVVLEDTMVRKILVATDGSAPARAALDFAIDLAPRYGATLLLIHAFPRVSDLLGTPQYDHLVTARTLNGQKLLEAARTQVGDAVPVEIHLVEEPAAPAILRIATDESCDMIVMGS